MADQKISAMTPATSLAGTELIPIVQGGTNLSATMRLLKTLPPIKSLSGFGITSDAAGAIGYGSTAPSGTDRTAAIQAVFAALDPGDVLIWDVAVGLSAPILVPSSCTICAPSRSFGAILRAGANCPIFRNAGIATDSTTNKQNTFGQLDGSHSGNAAYRLLNIGGGYYNNFDIKMVGGTWNPNAAQQTSNPFTATYGFPSVFQFWGVWKVYLQDLYILKGIAAIPVHFANWYDINIRNCEIDNSPNPGSIGSNNVAGFQFNGPGSLLRMYDPITHATDDHIALNADDSDAAAINSAYGGGSVCTPGVNWVQCGDITDVRVYGHSIGNGIENTIGFGGIRLLTTAHLIDDVLFYGTTGQTQYFSGNIGTWQSVQCAGAGNIGRLDLVQWNVDLQNPLNSYYGFSTFDLRGSARSIRILDRKRGNIPANGAADVAIIDPDSAGIVIDRLVLTGEYYEDVAGGNNPAPQIYAAAACNSIFAKTQSDRDVSFSAAASPVLLTATGALINLFDFSGDLNRATNVVNHQGGVINSVFARGSHRNASGGSPLNIASGLVVTNTWYQDLAFKSGVSFAAGAGSVTNNNSYVESAGTVENLSTFLGANQNLDVYTPVTGGGWQLFNNAASTKPICGGGTCTIAPMSSGESDILCDATVLSGTITVSNVLGYDGNTDVAILFGWENTNNFAQAVWSSNSGHFAWYSIVSGSVAYSSFINYTLPAGPVELSLVVGSTTVAAYVNGIQIASVAKSNFATAAIYTLMGLKVDRAANTTSSVSFSQYKVTSP